MDLKDLLRKETIIMDARASTKEEALACMCECLVRGNYVEEGYYAMLAEREEKFPTGLSTRPFEIAIPHTDPQHVLKPCIAILKLRRPVEFVEMTRNGTVHAKFVFGLVLKKSDEQVMLLQRVISLFSDEAKMCCLNEAATPEALIAMLCDGCDDRGKSASE